MHVSFKTVGKERDKLLFKQILEQNKQKFEPVLIRVGSLPFDFIMIFLKSKSNLFINRC